MKLVHRNGKPDYTEETLKMTCTKSIFDNAQ